MRDSFIETLTELRLSQSRISVIKNCYFIPNQVLGLIKEHIEEPENEIPEETITLLGHNIYALNFKYSPTKKCEMSPELYSYLIMLYCFQVDMDNESPGYFDFLSLEDFECKVLKKLSYLLLQVDIRNAKPEITNDINQKPFYAISDMFKLFIQIVDTLPKINGKMKLPIESQSLTDANKNLLESMVNNLLSCGFTQEVLKILKLFYIFTSRYKLEDHIIYFHTNFVIHHIIQCWNEKGNFINKDKMGPFTALNYFHKFTTNHIYNYNKFRTLGIPELCIKFLSEVIYSDVFLGDLLAYTRKYSLTQQVFDNISYSDCEKFLKKSKDFKISMYFLQQLIKRHKHYTNKNIKLNSFNSKSINISLCFFVDMQILSCCQIDPKDSELLKYYSDYNNNFYSKQFTKLPDLVSDMNLNHKIVCYNEYISGTSNALMREKLPFLGKAVVVKMPFHSEVQTEIVFIDKLNQKQKAYYLHSIIIEEPKALLTKYYYYFRPEGGEWVKINSKFYGLTQNSWSKITPSITEELKLYKINGSSKIFLFYKEIESYSVYSLFKLDILKTINDIYSNEDIPDLIECMKYNTELTQKYIDYLIRFFTEKGRVMWESFFHFLQGYLPQYVGKFIAELQKDEIQTNANKCNNG